MSLFTPEAAAKLDLLFDKSGLCLVEDVHDVVELVGCQSYKNFYSFSITAGKNKLERLSADSFSRSTWVGSYPRLE
jgi:hypothetical protein